MTIVTNTETMTNGSIAFVPGTSRLSAKSAEILQAVANTMLSQPSILQLEVGAHVFEGRRSERLALSWARAEQVRDALIRKGVARSRLAVQGYGDSQPLGCPVDLADLVSRHQPVVDMRRADAWSPFAESTYLLGTLDERCKASSSENTRISFMVLKQTPDSKK